jgi:hypothetical protein
MGRSTSIISPLKPIINLACHARDPLNLHMPVVPSIPSQLPRQLVHPFQGAHIFVPQHPLVQRHVKPAPAERRRARHARHLVRERRVERLREQVIVVLRQRVRRAAALLGLRGATRFCDAGFGAFTFSRRYAVLVVIAVDGRVWKRLCQRGGLGDERCENGPPGRLKSSQFYERSV